MADESNLTVNQISKAGKIWGGFLFIFFTVLAIVFLFAFWPDKLPQTNENSSSLYSYKLFKIHLLQDTICSDSIYQVKVLITDTAKNKLKNDSTDTSQRTTTSATAKSNYKLENRDKMICRYIGLSHQTTENTIELNTIFLILVAITGFLGNMVHVATSFTTFIGNNDFKKSWTLWYVVKPFTAAALAIILYFVIRAGFLNYSADAKNISLYGVLAFSALAGLFTDTATLKLKEVFETLFRPKDDRTGKTSSLKIDGVVPDKLQPGINHLSIRGSGLTTKKLTIRINNQEVTNTNVQDTAIDFTYTLGTGITSQSKIPISVVDETNTEIFKWQLSVQ